MGEIRSIEDAETTKADEIGAALERAILFGELPPGTMLRQEQLADQYGVSRTPIREALRRLDALGLVVFRPNRGVLVRAASRDELRQSIVARAALEGAAAEQAAVRITPEQLERLEQAHERYVELTRRLQTPGLDDATRQDVTFEWLRVNDTFHDVVLEAAGMPLLRTMARSVRRALRTPPLLLSDDVQRLHGENLRQHRALLEALRAGNARAARELMADHILATGRLIDVILDRTAGNGHAAGPARTAT
jgi:DNA-binding GntR family transcriptional regulator